MKIFHGKYDPSVPYTHSTALFEAISAKYPRSRVFPEIFDGGHEIDEEKGFDWLLSQYRKRERTALTG